MQDKYELIPYDDTNFLFSLYRLNYVLPHIHREIEIGVVLSGEMRIFSKNQNYSVHEGDFWIINSCQSHSVMTAIPEEDCIMTELQISFRFFELYYPEFQKVEFPFCVFGKEQIGESAYLELLDAFYRMTLEYFGKGHHYELKTAGLVNLFFDRLLDLVPVEWISEEKRQADFERMARIRRLTDYIKEGYENTLFLNEIAQKEGLSMSRLSHFFKESFGMSFQDYLLRLRADKARMMLEQDEKINLIDVSVSCGFSDPKYFNSGFKKIYGISPRDYRKKLTQNKSKTSTFNIALALTNMEINFAKSVGRRLRRNIFCCGVTSDIVSSAKLYIVCTAAGVLTQLSNQ